MANYATAVHHIYLARDQPCTVMSISNDDNVIFEVGRN